MTEQRLADAAWLTDGPLARVFDILDRDGEEARAVGGAVRNALLGLPVGEIDVATTALPDEVMRRAKQAGIRTVPTGIDHGTVTLLVDGQPFEVTTLREDVETYGRKARVAFGRDWKRDAERRDFTMNALSASRDGIVHDYVGGLADLKARHVRFIGNAVTRIEEDYLRILRFFRFRAAYGEGEPDKAALAACIAGREGMETLSRERVRAELLKLLVANRAVPAVAEMAEIGLLVRILGGVPLPGSLDKMVRIESALELTPDAVRRLGALALFVSEDAERLFQRLRMSNGEAQRLLSMADGWWRISGAMKPAAARALLYRLGPAKFLDRVLLAWSRSQDATDDTRWRDLFALPGHWPVPSLPISASDLIARGIAKGPGLGAALRAAEAAWIAADFPQDQVTIAAMVDEALKADPEPNKD
ncbi:CCA tRNA nucleotidyltransferase [Pseudorhodoplanes sinuspersici]|uniref:CCA tRNA nucleotidyltransferase n=1 Tax=Pseudorhodoplanes sinuspersici TaxID=1235591 RepID=A0A1W6ZKT2_9HYPH|nr:CCA tRNA nucleotidyltransferase [Pseudorhodoplanes sinuspersici]ARP97740.1 CCA tRNA nucleotidyltransferase [Pseudorhodoplanes sinuspersici]RKE68536.1 poly(A) polymerase [Pseudorhodoplanes sinuspersici]